MELTNLMGYEIIKKIKNREITVGDVISETFARIEKFDGLLHSFVNLSKEKAFEKAKEYDAKIQRGKKLGSLYGLPFANKDLICIKDFPTTCCSKILQGYRPPYNAYVIERLVQQEGAIHIGNTNMDEFAFGSSTEASCYGASYNPWDLERVPGGSSGGGAAAIATG
ncbi:MAG: amidase family protein, partial [Promethearchaeota archaeon]